jgi:putative aminopeptidase FrvX
MNIAIGPMLDFLKALLAIPSPTGYHREALPFMEQAFAALAFPGLSIQTTLKGALLLHISGAADDAPRALAAHADTLGLMVKEIKDSGALKVDRIGGVMWNGAEFENVTVRTFNDQRYRGTLIPVNPSSHVNPDILTQPRNADTLEVRLDALTTSAAQTRALGIEVGDFVFLDPRVEQVETGFIRARFLDNKAGVAVIYGALQALRDAGIPPAQRTTILIANYEEVGHGGSHGLPADLHELLVIDMGALGKGQNGDEFSVSLCVKDAGGPYHYDMNEKLRRLAQAHNIPLKPDLYPFYRSDGSAYWAAGGGARVALIGPGVASSHSYERTHTDSLAHTAHLIARYLATP